MGLSRAQVKAGILTSITDPLNRQNTAAIVRAVLNLLNDNFFNLEDDELSIGHITGLSQALADLQDAIANIDPEVTIGDVTGLQDALNDIQAAINAIDPEVTIADIAGLQDLLDAAKIKEYLLLYDEVTLEDKATVFRTRKIQLLGTSFSDQISSVNYEVKADGSSYIAKATLADVNDWISTTISNGNKYWIKVNRVAASGAAGEAWVEIIYKEIA